MLDSVSKYLKEGGTKVEQNYLNWKSLLSELNDFSCKVEFLQSKMRFNIINLKSFNKQDYLDSLHLIESEHEQNLAQFSLNEGIKYIIPLAKVESQEIFH